MPVPVGAARQGVTLGRRRLSPRRAGVRGPQHVKILPDYGKSIKYPPHPAALDWFVKLLQKIHMNWRAKMIVKTIPPEKRAIVRRKIFTSGIFRGKKPYDLNKKFEGDYLAQTPELARTFASARGSFLGAVRDHDVVFSAMVTKVSRKGRADSRGLALSEGHLFKLDPKTFKVHKEAIPLRQITGVAVSSKKDTLVVVHVQGGFDLLADLGLGAGGDKVSEFVVVLLQTMDKANLKRVPVQFSEHLHFTTEHIERTITIQQDTTGKAREKQMTLFKRSSPTQWQALCPTL